jgi:hypothetical protein
MVITIAGGLLIAAALTLDRNKSIKSWPFLTDKPVASNAVLPTPVAAARSVTRLQRQAILSTGTGYTSRQSLEMVPTIISGQMKKVGPADWRTSNGLPSVSDPETEADRTPRGSSLAVMNANVSHV